VAYIDRTKKRNLADQWGATRTGIVNVAFGVDAGTDGMN
jgi:hypothetical protein